uniref:Uncharacterized protein n=1 Tax=Maylandia zebra TaxID=106582 RepID=A0A3P9BZ69_9CICH
MKVTSVFLIHKMTTDFSSLKIFLNLNLNVVSANFILFYYIRVCLKKMEITSESEHRKTRTKPFYLVLNVFFTSCYAVNVD